MNSLTKAGVKFAAGAAIAAAAVFAPISAYAVGGYVPSSDITISDSTPAPGGSATISFLGSAFDPSEAVNFVLEGENASGATLAVITPAALETKSFTKAADATGAVSVTVTLPSNATGTYKLTGTGVTSGNIGTATLTATTASGDTLENTSANNVMLWGWAGAGALILVGGGIVVAASVRRQRASR